MGFFSFPLLSGTFRPGMVIPVSFILRDQRDLLKLSIFYGDTWCHIIINYVYSELLIADIINWSK